MGAERYLTASLSKEMMCPCQHGSRRAAPLRTGDGPSLHHLTARRTEQNGVGGRVVCWMLLSLRLGICAIVKLRCFTSRKIV